MRTRPFLATLLLAAVTLACSSDAVGPAQQPEGQLTFLRLGAAAPPFQSSTVSFYARRGTNREGSIHFVDERGGRGEEFARLKVDATSLLARPDGTPFLTGDSVLITMRVVDVGRMIIELQPAGLRFAPTRPAELKLDYDFADEDYNRDGVTDQRDREAEQRFSIWRQRRPGDPFVRIGSVKVEGFREIEARLTEFSRYAIAY